MTVREEGDGLRPRKRGTLAGGLGGALAPGVEQVAIVSGLQESLDLIARVFLNPGDRVCMENPGYIGAERIFEAVGARISALRVADEGMEVPRARRGNIRLAYVTPGHQFPLGVSMSLPRRLALLEWARASDALIIEDDYDSEYRYSDRPLSALQGLDRSGVVLFVGSFSKVMFPSMRLGYVVVPPDGRAFRDGEIDHDAPSSSARPGGAMRFHQ